MVLLLRPEIKRLLALVRKLKAGPVEAEFERDVAALVIEDDRGGLTKRIGTIQYEERLSLFEVAKTNPRAAIADAWQRVEASADRATSRKSLKQDDQGLSVSSPAFAALVKAGFVPPEWTGRYYELKHLRNRALHDGDFSPSVSSAAAYVELSLRLRAVLDAIASDG